MWLGRECKWNTVVYSDQWQHFFSFLFYSCLNSESRLVNLVGKSYLVPLLNYWLKKHFSVTARQDDAKNKTDLNPWDEKSIFMYFSIYLV